MIEPVTVARLLAIGRFDLTHEAQTQADIDSHLRADLPAGVRLEREFKLSPGDRPDFMVDGAIAIEVKVKGSREPSILKQLARYARHDRVKALILATGRAVQMPPKINGKPLFCVNLGRAWL